MLIEQNTNYAYKLKYIEHPSFDKVRDLSVRFYREQPKELQEELFEALHRGVDILDSEPEMATYLYTYGKMHQAKLEYAFSHLPEKFLSQPEINIVDYGCGQTVGTMCYADYLRDKGYAQEVKTITLIEPSEICLKRAALHASVFFPDAEIKTVNKNFDALDEDDIYCGENVPTLHILSNVLDILSFDLERFSDTVKQSLKGYNQFVCVGPYFFDFARDRRIDVFLERMEGEENFSETLDQYKLDLGKDWTCKVKMFSRNDLLPHTFSTKRTKADFKEAVEDEFGSLYSKDGKRLLFVGYGETINIKYGTEIICDWVLKSFVNYQQLFIPDTITAIGDYAFRLFHSQVQSVHLPKSVSHIGKNPFLGWHNVMVTSDSVKYSASDGFLIDNFEKKLISYWGKDEMVAIPTVVTSIGDSAFSDCESLQQIIIPNSVTTIGDSAFRGCESLQQIIIPDSVTTIGNSAFSGCKSLQQIIIPDSVTTIGYSAFEECESLQQMIIPNSVTSIGHSAFSGCKSLQQMIIPNSVTSIGELAFYRCESLQRIHLPKSVSHIEPNSFLGCYNVVLTSDSVKYTSSDGFIIDNFGKEIISYWGKDKVVTIPDSVTSIGNKAFLWCDSLQQINLPDSVASIGDSAFEGCKSLQRIHLPKSVSHIGKNSFLGCHNVVVTSDCVKYTASDGFIIDYFLKKIIFYSGKDKMITIPASVTSIGDSAFRGCDSLQQIIIPDSVTSIGDSAFSWCKSLQQIFIPDSVTSIGDSTFSGCVSLLQIIIPNSVTSIGNSAFSGCKSLQRIIMPDPVTSIGNFTFEGCDSLQQIVIPIGFADKYKEMLDKTFEIVGEIVADIYVKRYFCNKEDDAAWKLREDICKQ